MYKRILGLTSLVAGSNAIDLQFFDGLLFGNPSADEHSLLSIGGGVCQALAGYDMYNLKPLDELHRVPTAYTPAVIDTKKGAFFYKLCQGTWGMKADYYSMTKDKAPGSLPDSCKNKYGNAYFVVDGDC
jgi:hypothetical protein